MEQWKSLNSIGYPNYEASSEGRIRNIVRKNILKEGDNGCGYMRVVLCNEEGKKNFYIHRLIAFAFLPNPYNKPEVDHIDGCKSNNNVNNLRWVTPSENCLNPSTNTDERRRNISIALTGRKLSDIHKQRIGKSSKGRQSCLGKHWKLIDGKRVWY
jgi:hypothetical protein